LYQYIKKGDRKDVQNYRGLSINSVFSRLYTKVIKNKLERELKDLIGEDQSGIRAGRSCVDNLFVVQQLIEKRTSVGEETHLALIGLEKAYDSVPRCRLWEILTEISIDPESVEVIMEIYDNNIAYVQHGNTLLQPIVPTKGLRQGCSLSPVLFNIYIEQVLKVWKLNCQGMGIPVNDRYLFTLNYADDQAVIAQDQLDLEFMLRRLQNAYESWGLTLNLKKN
jgi:hypothetical protein